MKIHVPYFIFSFVLILFLAASHGMAATDSIKEKAQAYLQNLTTTQANFIQTSADGHRLTGTFYLNRPGKLRFIYNEVKDFIVADGVFIYFYDSEMGEQTNAPIGQTLADFLLRENLNLDSGLKVTGTQSNEKYDILSLRQAEDEAAGEIILYFTHEPYTLDKWQIIDATGAMTEVSLSHIQNNVDLPASLFTYIAPKQDKPNYN